MSSTTDEPLTHSRDRLLDGPETERITYRERAEHLAAVDRLIDDEVYTNRSEAIRAAVRQLVADAGGDP